MPPPVHTGERLEPARARPVPFWRHGLAPPPETAPRVFVAAVPRLRAACSARTLWCTSGPWKRAPKARSSSVTLPAAVPSAPSIGASGIGAHLHEPSARAGDRAAHHQQVLLLVHRYDLETQLGHAPVAHLAWAADALDDARGRRRGADRAGRADVVRAVCLGTADEVVALDRPLEALSLRYCRDLHARAHLELGNGYGIADLLAALAAELGEPAQRRGVGLGEVPELGSTEVLGLALAK